jgi:transcriptional regulator with XRE-family HTH domain
MGAGIVSKAAVGTRLRSLRKHKGLTLKELSQASGVPLSTLSKIELGLASLNYGKFMLIAQALNVDMSVLLQATDKFDAMHLLAGKVLKASSLEHDEYSSGNYQHKFLFSETSGKAMTPILATVFSREVTDFNEFIKHPGQEFAFVLSGSVNIVFENGNSITLKKNEAAYFDSTVGHVYLSRSKEPARVLAVCSDRS